MLFGLIRKVMILIVVLLISLLDARYCYLCPLQVDEVSRTPPVSPILVPERVSRTSPVSLSPKIPFLSPHQSFYQELRYWVLLNKYMLIPRVFVSTLIDYRPCKKCYCYNSVESYELVITVTLVL